MIFRKALNSDAEQFIKLKNEVWRDAYKDILPKEVFDENDKVASAKIERFKQNKLNQNGNVCWVAEENDKLIGLALASAPSKKEYFKDLGYAELGALYVHKNFQHKGIGRKLFDCVVEDFKNLGFTKMTIGVFKENFQARKAYEKWGGVLKENFEMPVVLKDKKFAEVFYLFDLR